MRIKKYEVSDIKDAIKMIKEDFGSEAVILHSRTFQKGGLFGLFTKEMVEVMAGSEINVIEPKSSNKNTPPQKKYNITEKLPANPSNADSPKIVESTYSPKTTFKDHIKATTSALTLGLDKKVTTLSKDVDELKDTLHLIVKKVVNAPHPMISPKSMTYYQLLDNIGISEELSVRIIQKIESKFKEYEIENYNKITAYIKQMLIQLLGKTTPIEFKDNATQLIALVGPTGVGKTTTIAKMAANFSLIQNKKAALITLDTFRIAAIEQLKNYANIIGIPIEVVFHIDDFSKALRKLKDMDIILIDTAGRSPKHMEDIAELKKFLKSNLVDIYTVLSATSKPADMYKTIDRYNALGGDKIIFTKLDETDSFGLIVDIVAKFNKQLSYFTNGQNVPDDLEVAFPAKLVNLMFENL